MAAGTAGPAETLVMVATVIDGDTITLTNGDTVRYAGVDTPEFDHRRGLAQFLAQAARDMNRRLVAGKPVRLETDRQARDGYGRLVAYVFLDDGTMVNQALVEQGLAFCAFHPPNLTYFLPLLEAQRAAIAAGRGLWRDVAGEKRGLFIGNRRSLRFHTANCTLGKKTAATNRTVFSSRREALREGFAPCKRCLDAVFLPLSDFL